VRRHGLLSRLHASLASVKNKVGQYRPSRSWKHGKTGDSRGETFVECGGSAPLFHALTGQGVRLHRNQLRRRKAATSHRTPNGYDFDVTLGGVPSVKVLEAWENGRLPKGTVCGVRRLGAASSRAAWSARGVSTFGCSRTRAPETTPGASAPPLLIQEGSSNGSPPQMRRGVRQPTDGVVLSRSRNPRRQLRGAYQDASGDHFGRLEAGVMARGTGTPACRCSTQPGVAVLQE